MSKDLVLVSPWTIVASSLFCCISSLMRHPDLFWSFRPIGCAKKKQTQPNQTQPNQTQPDQTKPTKPTNPNQTQPNPNPKPKLTPKPKPKTQTLVFGCCLWSTAYWIFRDACATRFNSGCMFYGRLWTKFSHFLRCGELES